MLPKEQAKETITVYSPTDETVDILFGNTAKKEVKTFFTKRVIEHCVWRKDNKKDYKEKGVADADAVKILIPWLQDYVPQEHFTGDGFTIMTGAENKASYIVRGECTFEFLWSIDNLLFMEDVLKFEKMFQYRHPKEIINYVEGSRNMWYIEVNC